MNSTLNEKGYRELVQKILFRENPPKPSTKENFVRELGLDSSNTSEINERYGAYLYCYFYSYKKKLEQKVEHVVQSNGMSDKRYQQMMDILGLKDSTTLEENPKEEEEITDNHRKGKHSIKSFFSKKFNKKEKSGKNFSKKKKNGKKKHFSKIRNFVSGIKNIDKLNFLATIFQGSGTILSIASAFMLTMKIPFVWFYGVNGSLTVGGAVISLLPAISAAAASLFSFFVEAKVRDKIDEIEEEYEEEDDLVEEKSDLKTIQGISEGLAKEKENDALSNAKVEEKPEKEISSIFKLRPSVDNGKPQFDREKEENHEKLQVGKPFIEHVAGEIVNKEDMPIFENQETDEEQYIEEPVKIKIK